jgi:hypothetical protein
MWLTGTLPWGFGANLQVLVLACDIHGLQTLSELAWSGLPNQMRPCAIHLQYRHRTSHGAQSAAVCTTFVTLHAAVANTEYMHCCRAAITIQ